MRTFSFLLAVFLPLVFATTEIAVEEGVLVLTDDNFEHAINEHKNMLVEFYAPWCGHCKSLAPEYAKAAKTLAESPVKLAKVDATAQNALQAQFEIKGFPTLKYFKNGKPSDYNGGRTESEIVSWLNKKIGPAAVHIKSEEDLAKFQESRDVFVLGVFSSPDSKAAKTFLTLADEDDLHTYAITHDSAVREKLGVHSDSVVVLKSFDDLRADLSVTNEMAEEDIADFVLGNSVPLVQEFSQETSKKIFSSQIQKHVLFFTNKDSAHHAETVAKFRDVAKAFKGKALVVNVPTSETRILEFFEVKPEDAPAAILADLGSESGIKKYPFHGDFSTSALTHWVNEFFEGKLTPHLKSEEVTPEDNAGDVVILRGKSFRDVVVNNDKDVLVEFYAPWCGHCKKLAPTWDQLGARFSAEKDKVLIAKMDATANEVDLPGMAVRGFPTIYFFKGNDKENPVKYEGGREFDDFVAYLEENVHNKISRDEL